MNGMRSMSFDAARGYLLERAAEDGLEIEVLARTDRELTLAAQNGALELLTEAEQGGIGIRLIDQGRAGYAYSEERSREALDWILAEAQENAALLEPGHAQLIEGIDLGYSDLLGDGLDEPLGQKLEAALGFEEDIREDPRVQQVPIARLLERESKVSLGSTKGVEGSYRTGAVGLLASVIMAEGESVKQGFEIAFERDFQALDPGRTAMDAIESTGRLLGARDLPSGRYTAYFEPKAFAQLLMAFVGQLSGKAVHEGKSQLAKKLGETIASETFTLVDDPTLEGRLASRPFDAEGTPAAPTTLIEAGQLQGFLHNSETARALGQANTGHAARGYRGTLDVAPSNLYVAAGTGVEPSDGIIVTDLMGVHAGANPISGDFSLQALGLKVEDGEVAYPVENFAISGNFLDLLQSVRALGDEVEWHFMGSYAGTPMVEVAEMSFAGA